MRADVRREETKGTDKTVKGNLPSCWPAAAAPEAGLGTGGIRSRWRVPGLVELDLGCLTFSGLAWFPPVRFTLSGKKKK